MGHMLSLSSARGSLIGNDLRHIKVYMTNHQSYCFSPLLGLEPRSGYLILVFLFRGENSRYSQLRSGIFKPRQNDFYFTKKKKLRVFKVMCYCKRRPKKNWPWIRLEKIIPSLV